MTRECTALTNAENTGIATQTEEEQILAKLESFKVGSLTAKEQEEQKKKIKRAQCQFIHAFIVLSWEIHGLSKAQLSQLSEKEMRFFAKILLRQTRLRRLMQKAFIFSTPVGWLVEWLCLDDGDGFVAWRYAHHGNQLKKFNGPEYFPYDEIRKYL